MCNKIKCERCLSVTTWNTGDVPPRCLRCGHYFPVPAPRPVVSHYALTNRIHALAQMMDAANKIPDTFCAGAVPTQKGRIIEAVAVLLEAVKVEALAYKVEGGE